MTKPIEKLSKKHRLFVDEYLVDLSAVNAAKRAGFSPRTARQAGYNLLQMPLIRQAVDAALAARAKKTGFTAEMVLSELALIGFIPLEQCRRGGVNVSDKRAALVDIGKHIGMFVDRHEVTGKDGQPIEVDIDSALERLAASVARYAAQIGAHGGDELLN